MSVFSLDVQKGNPVTTQTIDDLCQTLGVALKAEEKGDYERLLAIFHDSVEALMAMPGA
jgi:amidase